MRNNHRDSAAHLQHAAAESQRRADAQLEPRGYAAGLIDGAERERERCQVLSSLAAAAGTSAENMIASGDPLSTAIPTLRSWAVQGGRLDAFERTVARHAPDHVSKEFQERAALRRLVDMNRGPTPHSTGAVDIGDQVADRIEAMLGIKPEAQP